MQEETISNRKKRRLAPGLGLLAAVMFADTASAALLTEANYYVRPVLRVGGGAIQDGLAVNGPTTASQTQSVVGTSRSTVSLTDGTVKMYAEEFTSSEVGLQSFGGFGERLTIQGGAGTFWDIGFGLEGMLAAELGPSAPGAPPPQMFYDMSIVAFDAGIADVTNFFGLARDPCWGQDPLNCTPAPAPRAFEYQSDTIEIPVEDWDPQATENWFYHDVLDNISARVLLESNQEVLDIFVFANVLMDASAAGPDSGLESYYLDFENTAQYTQSFEDGVDVFSSSGEFLGLSTPPPDEVPAPGALGLVGLGLFAGWAARRKRRA